MQTIRLSNGEYRMAKGRMLKPRPVGGNPAASGVRTKSRDLLVPRPLSHVPRRGGFSLLEVLIATSILIFGILAIVKIFPAGLGVIKSNDNFTVGTRLAEDMQGRYERLKDQLPDAVIAVSTDANGNKVFVTNIDPTSTPDDNPTTNSIDSIKRVVGESHTVLSSGNIMVNFPPLARLDLTNADPELRNPRVYLPNTLMQVTGSPNGSNQYSVTNATLTFSTDVRARGNFARVSYAFIDKSKGPPPTPPTYYVQNERLPIPANGAVNVAGNNLPGLGNNFQLVDGSMTVVEERLLSIGTVDQTHGVIPVTDGAVTAGTSVVKVDYTVDDWRWITENDLVPNSEVVKLLFNDILQDGTSNPQKYVYVTSMQQGSEGTAIGTGSGVDYPNGTVALPSYKGDPMRITYQTGSQWLKQLVKAPATFTDVRTYDSNNNETTETYRHFADKYWHGGNDQQTLGFAQINAGKTVVVDYVDNTTGQAHYGELHTIGTSPGGPVYASYPYEILLYFPYRDIISVRGVSNTARVAWISDKGKFRKVEIPTYLAKS